ncbi:hypothetical protein MTO96_017619 [Rhipicephalus appendiculatus]
MYGYPVSQTPSVGAPAYGQESVNDMALLSNAPSSFFSGNKDGVMRDNSRATAVVIAVMIALGIIAVAATVIVLTSGSASHGQTRGMEEHPEITKKNARDASGLTVIVPEFRVTSMPPPSTRGSRRQNRPKRQLRFQI